MCDGAPQPAPSPMEHDLRRARPRCRGRPRPWPGEYPRWVTSARTVASWAERPATQPRTRWTSPCSSARTSGSGSPGQPARASPFVERRGRGCIRRERSIAWTRIASTQDRKYSGSRNAGSASIVRAKTSWREVGDRFPVANGRGDDAVHCSRAPAVQHRERQSVLPGDGSARPRLASGELAAVHESEPKCSSPSAKGEYHFADGWL